MKSFKLFKLFNYFSIIIFNIVILLISYNQIYNLSLFFTILYYFLIIILIFLFSIFENSKNKRYIYLYFLTYILFLISLTLFLQRSGFGLIDKDYFSYYIRTINLIPFKTILSYAFSINDIKSFCYNILGNLVALLPFSLLLYINDERYSNLKKQFFALSILALIIELFQLLFCTGRFDIDDYILNVGGALLFFKLFKFSNLFSIASEVLNKFRLISLKTKIILYFVIYFIILFISIYLLNCFVISNKKTYLIKDQLLIVKKEQCDIIKQFEYENYIFNLNCIDVFYETKDNYQLDLEYAFNNNYLSLNKFMEILRYDNFLYDEQTLSYIDIKNNNRIYVCDNNIYFIENGVKKENLCNSNK